MRSPFRSSTASALTLAALLWALPGLALAAALPAQPTSVLFYPDEAQVTVQEKLKPENLPGGGQGFVLTLPAEAQRETFFITVGEKPAGGYFWKDEEEGVSVSLENGEQIESSGAFLPENEPSPERRALLEAVIAMKEEVARRQGALAATEARMELWKPKPSKEEQAPNPEVMAKLDTAYSQYLPALYQAHEKENRAVQEARLRLAKAEKSLSEYDESRHYQTVIVPFDGDGKTVQAVSYGYVLPASCGTSYRIGAYPGKESLTIEQDATLYQNSGQAWNDVDVFISTTPRDRTLQPQTSYPWRIALYDNRARNKDERVSEEAMPMAMASAPMAQVAVNSKSEEKRKAPARAQQAEKSTFRLWSLGKQRIASDAPVRLPLSSDSYKVRYLYTLRPATNPKGFLTADISLPQALELPLGSAQFLVDGVAVGQQDFSFNGDKATIFFGSDPQVTATMRDLKRTTGEQGFISKEQTVLWHWQITLKSTRNHPVEVQVEDSAPDLTDTALKAEVTSTPKPEEATNSPAQGGAKIYRWKATLKPGEPTIIDHMIQVTAPSDKTLQPGRGTR